MASQLKEWVAGNKETIETVMEIFEQGAEIIASVVGEFFPIFQIAAPIVKLALDNVESTEAEYMKEQFQKVRDKLDVVSEEITSINNEIKKSGMDQQYFGVEENLTNQFRKFMDILNAKPKFKEVKRKLFLDFFSRTGKEQNLEILYNAVMGAELFTESILNITLVYEEKNRRVMEDFCSRLKRLFCIGLIALIGHAALLDEDTEELGRQWGEKMEAVETKMKSVIEDCKNFAEQAESDTRKRLKEKNDRTNQEFSQYIFSCLVKKYDWVKWSVRVYNHSGNFFHNWRAGKVYHSVSGESYFQLFDNNTNVVVSYSVKPEPVDKAQIQQLMERLKKTRNMKKVAEDVYSHMPSCVVHAVSRYKEVSESKNFTDECHYFRRHKNVSIYIHSG
ncbi:protein rapunzel-like [Acipenser ruthenus]|uniref:protein rapunzel-like n=1 Tax=Acipenser ruthenus TaxID=7906 RepID=UPI002740FFBD|nr:protein rapunzel-like [Acipenser ruthenus]